MERGFAYSRSPRGGMLISAVVGGLFIYVIFERFLKKALHRAQDQRKAIEVGTLVVAVVAVGLATGSLVYTLSMVDDLQERITTLEKEVQSLPRLAVISMSI